MRSKNIPVIILISLCVSFLFSCDNRKDYLQSLNKEPVLKIKKDGTSDAFTSSVSDSFKLENLHYICDYTFTDEKIENVILSTVYGSGSGTAAVDASNKTLVISPVTPGTQSIDLTATDQFGAKCTCNVSLTAFANLLPLAFVNVIQTDIDAPHEVNIDASASYDRDARFGGHIVQYEYKVGTTYIVDTPFSNINYIFAAPGNYNIYVRVEDNNGGWSPTKTTNITVL